MMADGGISAGEATGIVGIIMAVLTPIGAAIAWLANQHKEARRTREEKLADWHDELVDREKQIDEGRTAYTKRLEDRLERIERSEQARDIQMRALRLAFELVSSALRAIDPQNRALSAAEELLRTAFPVSADTPTGMIMSMIDLADTPLPAPRNIVKEQP